MEQPEIQLIPEDSSSVYAVKLPAFEGPLDLLLHLIKKSEINIYDVPISLITQQYIEYLEFMKSINLNVVGEFLVMAATLIHIKSKMLLPVTESEDQEDGADPREELINRLVEYRMYKDAAQQLEKNELKWREVFRRSPDIPTAEKGDLDLSEVSLFDLLGALKDVLEKVPEKRSMEIMIEELSVHDRMSLVLDHLEGQESISFISFFDGSHTRAEIIVTFLAILELIRLKLITVVQADPFGAIRIWKKTS